MASLLFATSDKDTYANSNNEVASADDGSEGDEEPDLVVQSETRSTLKKRKKCKVKPLIAAIAIQRINTIRINGTCYDPCSRRGKGHNHLESWYLQSIIE